MIQLTLLDHHTIVLNCDLIAWMSAQPDTTLRMVTGESLVVREPVDDVVQRIVDFRVRVLSAVGLDAALAPASVKSAAVALRAVRDDEQARDDAAESRFQ